MCQARLHGLTFTLIPDPEGTLWIDIRRDQDGLALVSAPFEGTEEEFDEAVTEWLEEFTAQAVTTAKYSVCRSCGVLRRPVQRDEDGAVMPEFRIEYSFDLCPACADHLVRTNPWIEKSFGRGDDGEVSDW